MVVFPASVAHDPQMCFLGETGLLAPAGPETDPGTHGRKFLSYTGPAVLLMLICLGSHTETAVLQG